MKMAVAELKDVVAGELRGDPDVIVSGVTHDSRKVNEGDLFVALPGAASDGHDYVAEAMQGGARAALVTREIELSGKHSQIVVGDVLKALEKLASHTRDVIDPIVVGVTGSVGKTTTKDMVASVASRKLQTVSAERSFNTEVGVPLTLLKLRPGDEVLVAELASRGPGQIARLCEYVRPQIGIVTNVGITHYAQFKSPEAIAYEKGALIRALPDGGTAVLNADDPAAASMSKDTSAHVVTFSERARADVRAEKVELDSAGRPRFRLVFDSQTTWCELEVSGVHQVSNALAAAATGTALGLSLDECGRGLEQVKSAAWRMDVSNAGGVTFVNDAYSSNPASLAAALETCRRMVRGGRLVAVLGEMAELGEVSDSAHRSAGETIAKIADRLVVVGSGAEALLEGARAKGLKDSVAVQRPEDIADHLDDLTSGDLVLVKASRVVGLERVVEVLKHVAGAK